MLSTKTLSSIPLIQQDVTVLKEGDQMKPKSIESHLRLMTEAAENKNYDKVEAEYKLALDIARVVVGEDAPLLLLLLCMARHYESQSKLEQAERFNRRARHLIIAGHKKASAKHSS